MNETTCPECESKEVHLEWFELPGLPEVQLGDCLECGHHWNECAR